MKALILAAGMGTRLEPLTLAVPKPMVPVVCKPVMEHNLELLRRYGFTDITANLHYFPEQVENYFSDGSAFGVKLSYSYEDTLLGTAGGVRRMGRELDNIRETFLVLSSDALTDINLKRLVAFHKKKKAIATIALQPVSDTSEFGVVATDDLDKITAFQEKPSKEEAISNLVNTGIYVFEPEILDMISEGHYDFGRQLFPELVKRNLPFYGYKMVEYWADVGSLAFYKQANFDILKGFARINIPGRRVSKNLWIGKDAKMDRSVKLDKGVIIGNSVKIGAHVEIVGETVIGDMCTIGDDVKISKSIIWSDTFVGKGSIVNQSIIGSWCYIEKEANIGQDSVISNRCGVRAGRTVPPETRLNPNGII